MSEEYKPLGNREVIKLPVNNCRIELASEVGETTINIEDDFRDMMPTSEEFYDDFKPTEKMLRESLELDFGLENSFKCEED